MLWRLFTYRDDRQIPSEHFARDDASFSTKLHSECCFAPDEASVGMRLPSRRRSWAPGSETHLIFIATAWLIFIVHGHGWVPEWRMPSLTANILEWPRAGACLQETCIGLKNSRVPRISILLDHRNRRKGRRKVRALQTACPRQRSPRSRKKRGKKHGTCSLPEFEEQPHGTAGSE